MYVSAHDATETHDTTPHHIPCNQDCPARYYLAAGIPSRISRLTPATASEPP